MEEKYKEGDEFYEVTFEVPRQKISPSDFAGLVKYRFRKANNIKITRCEIEAVPKRLTVRKEEQDNVTYYCKEGR